MSKKFLGALTSGGSLIPLMLLAGPAYAQGVDPEPPTAERASEQSDIVVTGSRIPQANLRAASPVTVVSEQEVKLNASTRIEDLINNLPQAFASQSSSVSYTSPGTATVNLRNLGDQRTLVLVNGRRLMPGDPKSKAGAADVNNIPQQLVKRVELLTGGASSVYGSDAVAGVVNFILDNKFEGISLDASYGFYVHNNDSNRFQDLSRAFGAAAPSGTEVDGQQFEVSLKTGVATSDGRGHVVGYAGYRKVSSVVQGDRDFSSCTINPGPAGASEYVCGGSATAAPANFTLRDAVAGGPPTSYTLNASGALVTGRSLYNANPFNYFQRPDERYTAGVMADYELSDAVKPYAEFMFMDDSTSVQLSPSGIFGNVTTISCSNPLLSAAQVSTFCRASNLVRPSAGAVPTVFFNPDGTPYNRANVVINRRNVEGEVRDADIRHTAYRFVMGTRGDLAKGVSYDVYGQFGRTTLSQSTREDISVVKANRAIDVIAGPNGAPVCRSVVDGSDPNCVPLNYFGTGPVSPAALNYIRAGGLIQGKTSETVINGSVTFLGQEYGLQLPWTDTGIGLNIGAEYRKETLSLDVDQGFASGDLAGELGATAGIRGEYDVSDVFAELQIPIANNKPLLEELSINGGYRYSHYSTAGSAHAYKGELVWAPIRDIRFRASYNRAVRAPNVQELFLAQTVQNDGATDPCAGARPTFTQAQCRNLGVAANLYGLIQANPSNQYKGLVGGNPNLKPEKADTVTLGVILQPSILPGLSATIDLFSIKVDDIIDTLGTDTILQQCGRTGDPALCSLVRRDASGTLWQTVDGYTINTNINAGSLKTRGIDIGASYRRSVGKLGTIGVNFAGTYVDEFTRDKIGITFDCAGLYGAQCRSPQSKWRHSLRVSWDSPGGIGISARWRYLSATKYESTSSNPALARPFFPLDARIPAFSHFDLSLTARIRDNISLRVGANNIFDKNPPILSSAASPVASRGNGNTYPGIYDASGRYLSVGISIDLP